MKARYVKQSSITVSYVRLAIRVVNFDPVLCLSFFAAKGKELVVLCCW